MSDLQQMPLFSQKPEKAEDITRHTPFKATLDLFAEHLHREGKSEHTVNAFRADLRLLLEYLTDHEPGPIPVGQFTTSKLNRFLVWLESGRGVPCSRKSYARRVTTLKVYFKWLYGLGAVPLNPAESILQRSGPAPLSEVLSPSQIRHAIHYAGTMRKGDEIDTRPEMLLRLLLDTGIKKSEAERLTRASIDRANPRQPLLTIRHKSRSVYRERHINLDPDWLNLFDLYLMQYQPKETIFTCSMRNLEYILTDIGEGAEIPFKLSFEVLRWTCAVRDYRAGMEARAIREKLGLSEASWHETGGKIKKLAERLALSGE
jgi:site-specific recombinase XerD